MKQAAELRRMYAGSIIRILSLSVAGSAKLQVFRRWSSEIQDKTLESESFLAVHAMNSDQSVAHWDQNVRSESQVSVLTWSRCYSPTFPATLSLVRCVHCAWLLSVAVLRNSFDGTSTSRRFLLRTRENRVLLNTCAWREHATHHAVYTRTDSRAAGRCFSFTQSFSFLDQRPAYWLAVPISSDPASLPPLGAPVFQFCSVMTRLPTESKTRAARVTMQRSHSADRTGAGRVKSPRASSSFGKPAKRNDKRNHPRQLKALQCVVLLIIAHQGSHK